MESLLLLPDFKEFFEVPDIMPTARLFPHVVEVQRQQLGAILGRPLLAALGAAVKQARADAVLAGATAPGAWAGQLSVIWGQLWAGTDTLGGVKQYLAYASWARYLPFAPTTMVGHSLVIKTTDNSTPAPQGLINAQVITYLDTAQSYQAELYALLALMQPDLAQWLPTTHPCTPTPAGPQGTVTTIGIRRPL